MRIFFYDYIPIRLYSNTTIFQYDYFLYSKNNSILLGDSSILLGDSSILLGDSSILLGDTSILLGGWWQGQKQRLCRS